MLLWAVELKSHGTKPDCIKRISETENEGDKRITSILKLKFTVSISKQKLPGVYILKFGQ